MDDRGRIASEVLRSIFTVATCDRRPSRAASDQTLHAEPIPKLMLKPLVWRGDLRPVAYIDQLEPLSNVPTA